MAQKITKAQYDNCCRMANKFAFGATYSEAFDLYLTAAVEALIKASETYQQGSAASFDTYQYRCVMNALVNEKTRQAVHAMPKDDFACERLNGTTQDGKKVESDYSEDDLGCVHNRKTDVFGGLHDNFREDCADETIHAIILRSVNGNERNAQIVEMSFGIGCEDGEEMELKEIAKVFQLTHEAVRVIRKKSIEAMQKSNAAEILLSLVG